MSSVEADRERRSKVSEGCEDKHYYEIFILPVRSPSKTVSSSCGRSHEMARGVPLSAVDAHLITLTCQVTRAALLALLPRWVPARNVTMSTPTATERSQVTELVSQLKAGVIDDKQLFQELQRLQKDSAARKKKQVSRRAELMPLPALATHQYYCNSTH